MKRLLVALVVAGLSVVGLGTSPASAQTFYNPPGYGPGNPAGTGVGVAPTGYGAPGYPTGYGDGYGAGPLYGWMYGAYNSDYLVYYMNGGFSGYTYPSYYSLDAPSYYSYGSRPYYLSTAGAGAAQWWCMPSGSTIAVPQGQIQPTDGYGGCSYHP
ncbi:MAG TPA: hypothetical protein VII06_07270 [Chloroflexota bacterium]